MYFPYKSVELCVDCYEKKKHRTLYAFRSRLGIRERSHYKQIKKEQKPAVQDSSQNRTKIDTARPSDLCCPYCNSPRTESKGRGKRAGSRRYICKECRKSWSVSFDTEAPPHIEKDDEIIETPKKDKKPRASKEEQIEGYIKNKKEILISYKNRFGNSTQRWIKPKSLNGRMLKAYCYMTKEDRTFRIDRIKRVCESRFPGKSAVPVAEPEQTDKKLTRYDCVVLDAYGQKRKAWYKAADSTLAEEWFREKGYKLISIKVSRKQ